MSHNPSIVSSKEVVDIKVKNAAGDNLGKIEDIVLDKVSGQTRYVVLSFGGFLGMGDKFFAIPWKAIHYDPKDDNFVLNANKEKLEKAPGFDKNHWPDFTNEQWAQTITDYYKNF